MSRMKISGQTQGKLVFAYDIREGHITYEKLLPLLNKKVIELGIEAVIEEKELENVIGEVMYRVNEELFEGFEDLFSGKGLDIDLEKMLEEAIRLVLKK